MLNCKKKKKAKTDVWMKYQKSKDSRVQVNLSCGKNALYRVIHKGYFHLKGLCFFILSLKDW